MPAYFEQGFFVRVPAWHGLGVVLDEYPGRDEAMRLAGHDFDIVEVEDLRVALGKSVLDQAGQWDETTALDHTGVLRKIPGWKVLLRSDTLVPLHICQDTYQSIPNSVGYDFVEVLLEQGFKYETGITLKGGAMCALTLLLDEPITIPGDDSPILPYLGLDWAHDGSGALRGNSTSIRRVCANTVEMSNAEGRKLGTSFSIRHTKNWRARVEDARMAIRGVRAQSEQTEALALELSHLTFTDDQVKEFVERFTTPTEVLTAALTSQRVQTNVLNAQSSVFSLINGPTVPEAHRNTGWGLYNAAVEYLDHIRPTRGKNDRSRTESMVQRTLLKPNAAKGVALNLIREVAKV